MITLRVIADVFVTPLLAASRFDAPGKKPHTRISETENPKNNTSLSLKMFHTRDSICNNFHINGIRNISSTLLNVFF